MNGKCHKTIFFLAEMPVTNGVIQAQMLPIARLCAQKGHKVHIIETIGRFDSQEKNREKTEADLKENGIMLFQIKVPKRTFLPSIFYFSLRTKKVLQELLKNEDTSNTLIYARNYKFAPVVIFTKRFWKIPFIYSPRGAYVAERKHYQKTRDLLFVSLLAFFEKKAIQKSFSTVVETENFKKHLEEIYSIPEEKFSVIPNYFDSSLLPKKDFDRDKLRQELDLKSKKVIVYAGTMEVWYDFPKMFDLVSRLKKKDPKIFFLLFLKEDYARQESLGMAKKIQELAEKFNLRKDRDFKISSYPPDKRYEYLSACDAGICLTTPEKFKTMMMYLKIVDYLGTGLPIITNQEVDFAKDLMEKTGTGAIVDYDNWEKSIREIDPEKLFSISQKYFQEIKNYSSQKILPRYLQIFENISSK